MGGTCLPTVKITYPQIALEVFAKYVTTKCLVKNKIDRTQVTPTQWKAYIRACKPDIVTSLSDIPFTQRPYSQKRIMKSLERSTAWLADLLSSAKDSNAYSNDGLDSHIPNVFVHMVGAQDIRARRAFADGLVETLYGQDFELIKPLKTLDEGLSGYIFDLVPLKAAILGAEDESSHETVLELLKASLTPLPPQKLRIAHSSRSPHEILRLIGDVGIDLLDAPFAQRAADLGIALDFRFPVFDDPETVAQSCPPPLKREYTGRDIGHNLFSNTYAHDHSRLASLFLDAASVSELPDSHERRSLVCPCAACSPVTPLEGTKHSAVDVLHPQDSSKVALNLPYSRAYLHHLLHTHEMSSHTLLTMHNLSVVDRFFADIRKILAQPDGETNFRQEVERFHNVYDESLVVFNEAQALWAKVERERGKGRLAREKSASVVDKE